eukprot:11877622-Alexandrium_andersonii.AAC.1
MCSDARPSLHGWLLRVQLDVDDLHGRSSDNAWRQVRLREDHLHADENRKNAGELGRDADVRQRPHLVERLPAHVGCRRVDGRDVEQCLPRGLRVEPSMGVHGIGDDAPLVRALVPASGFGQAGVLAGRLDDSALQGLPSVFGDTFAAGRARGFQNLHQ